jgi:hypothetical protein
MRLNAWQYGKIKNSNFLVIEILQLNHSLYECLLVSCRSRYIFLLTAYHIIHIFFLFLEHALYTSSIANDTRIFV